MSIKATSFELLKPVFEAISTLVKAKSVVDNADGTYTLYSCDTKWITKGNTLIIDGNDYLVTAIDVDVSITVKGAALPVLLQFDAVTPKVFHGTTLMQLERLDNINLERDKMPMIWVQEITQSGDDNDRMSQVLVSCYYDIFFMMPYNAEWEQEQHDVYAIKQMRALMIEFLDRLKRSRLIRRNKKITMKDYDHARFGKYLSEQGHPQSKFGDLVSGCQLRITIPFLKPAFCTGCV